MAHKDKGRGATQMFNAECGRDRIEPTEIARRSSPGSQCFQRGEPRYRAYVIFLGIRGH